MHSNSDERQKKHRSAQDHRKSGSRTAIFCNFWCSSWWCNLCKKLQSKKWENQSAKEAWCCKLVRKSRLWRYDKSSWFAVLGQSFRDESSGQKGPFGRVFSSRKSKGEIWGFARKRCYFQRKCMIVTCSNDDMCVVKLLQLRYRSMSERIVKADLNCWSLHRSRSLC